MKPLEQIAEGTFVNDTTKSVVPNPIELTSKTFQDTLGHPESEEIAAAFAYASKEKGQWVAMSYDRFYEQVCKHIVLAMASYAAKKGQELPLSPEIKQDLEKGNFYPALLLNFKISQNPRILLQEAKSICDFVGYQGCKPILMLSQGVVNTIYKAQQQKS